jgi:hypothetical protein
MKTFAILLLTLSALPGLGGCAHVFGDISTLQDPKYPVTHQDVIAVHNVDNSPDVNLATRLAGETLLEQMRALGFNLADLSVADLELNYTVTDKNVPTTYGVTMPTVSDTMGDINGHPIEGTTFGDIVVPETRNVNFTTLEVTLQRLRDPKVIVWQGSIQAEAGDAQQYRTQFFHALLVHIGETVHGDAQLDVDVPPAKQP